MSIHYVISKKRALLKWKNNNHGNRLKKKLRRERNKSFIMSLYESIIGPKNITTTPIDWLNDKLNDTNENTYYGINNYIDRLKQLKKDTN